MIQNYSLQTKHFYIFKNSLKWYNIYRDFADLKFLFILALMEVVFSNNQNITNVSKHVAQNQSTEKIEHFWLIFHVDFNFSIYSEFWMQWSYLVHFYCSYCTLRRCMWSWPYHLDFALFFLDFEKVWPITHITSLHFYCSV